MSVWMRSAISFDDRSSSGIGIGYSSPFGNRVNQNSTSRNPMFACDKSGSFSFHASDSEGEQLQI
jgi:hypothetical protein